MLQREHLCYLNEHFCHFNCECDCDYHLHFCDCATFTYDTLNVLLLLRDRYLAAVTVQLLSLCNRYRRYRVYCNGDVLLLLLSCNGDGKYCYCARETSYT